MNNTNTNTINFRNLTEEDVELRTQMVRQNGVSLLIYKNSRVDASILNETVGVTNWKKEFHRDIYNHSLYCTVSIYDHDKKEWVGKQDVGTPSNTEEVKGEVSDAFKRACAIGLGIGAELYSAPFIWVSSTKCKIDQINGKYVCRDTFTVIKMEVENHKISELEIINDRTGEQIFSWVLRPIKVKNRSTVKTSEPEPSVETDKVKGLLEQLPQVLQNALGLTLTSNGNPVPLSTFVFEKCKDEEHRKSFLKFLERKSSGDENAEQYRVLLNALKDGTLQFGS